MPDAVVWALLILGLWVVEVKLGPAQAKAVPIPPPVSCTSTATVSVTVNANPTATATNNTPICAGLTVQLTGGGIGTA